MSYLTSIHTTPCDGPAMTPGSHFDGGAAAKLRMSTMLSAGFAASSRMMFTELTETDGLYGFTYGTERGRSSDRTTATMALAGRNSRYPAGFIPSPGSLTTNPALRFITETATGSTSSCNTDCNTPDCSLPAQPADNRISAALLWLSRIDVNATPTAYNPAGGPGLNASADRLVDDADGAGAQKIWSRRRRGTS